MKQYLYVTSGEAALAFAAAKTEQERYNCAHSFDHEVDTESFPNWTFVGTAEIAVHFYDCMDAVTEGALKAIAKKEEELRVKLDELAQMRQNLLALPAEVKV